MKKWICLFMLGCMIFVFCGCSIVGNNTNKLTFYYSKDTLSYGTQETFLTSVPQNSSLKKLPLKEVIAQYLQTPGNQSFSNKLYNAKIFAMVQENRKLYLTLSNEVRYLEGIDLTIGCACLAKTVFSLTDYETLIIDCQSGFKYVEGPIVLTRSNILLTDTYGLD